MKHCLILLTVLLPMCISAQNEYTFIGELLFNFENPANQQELPLSKHKQHPDYDDFEKKYNIYVYYRNTDILLKSELRPKETYYPERERRVEVRITESSEKLKQKSREVVIKFYNKETKERFRGSKPFHLEVSDSGKDEYINPFTFKLKKKINIGAPAYVGLDLMLTWLQRKMHGWEVDDFGGAVQQLTAFMDAGGNPCNADSILIRHFYRLYAFIDPYIEQNAFINAEALELNDEIQQLKQQPPLPGTPESEGPGIAAMDSLYNNYLRFADTLRLYHLQLGAILFSRKNCFYKTVSFVVGPSVISCFNHGIYSGWKPALSTGFLLRIVGKQRMEKSNPFLRSLEKPKIPGGFAMGFMVNCIFPVNSNDNATFGPGLALGYSANKLGFVINLGYSEGMGPGIGATLVYSFGKTGVSH